MIEIEIKVEIEITIERRLRFCEWGRGLWRGQCGGRCCNGDGRT